MEIKHRSVEIPISKRNWFKSQLVSINFVCLHRNVRYFRLHQSNIKKRPNEKKKHKKSLSLKRFQSNDDQQTQGLQNTWYFNSIGAKIHDAARFQTSFFLLYCFYGHRNMLCFLETRDQWLNQSNSVLSLEWHTKWKKSVFFVANSKYEEEKKFKLNLNDSKWQKHRKSLDTSI